MRLRKTLITCLTSLLLLVSAPALAQLDAFHYREARVPVGKVLHYLKSERDGSHPSRISVHVPEPERIESLKWSESGEEATLVVAWMDWSRFSVRRFEAWQLTRGQDPRRSATLDVRGDALHMSLMERPVPLHHWPWHSYDFDFTSLNLALPHRRSPRAELSFWRTDFVYGDPPTVAELGELRLTYQGRDRRDGRAAWRYTLGGAGLEGHQGSWWVDRRSGLTLAFELPVGDEPGYRDVRLRLLSIEPMTPEGWESFKASAIDGGRSGR
jgi:hypothetical protein